MGEQAQRKRAAKQSTFGHAVPKARALTRRGPRDGGTYISGTCGAAELMSDAPTT